MAESRLTRTSVAARLRAARGQAGLSQGQVAKLMRIHRPTVSEIEAGRRRVSAEELSHFAKVYDVSISWLTKEQPEVSNPEVELAARELAKLRKEDLDALLQLLRTFRKAESRRNE